MTGNQDFGVHYATNFIGLILVVMTFSLNMIILCLCVKSVAVEYND